MGTRHEELELQAAALHVPLILLSDAADSPQRVWQGLDLGAAEVLERPVSQSKLRNIWQHVVRKVKFAYGLACCLGAVRDLSETASCCYAEAVN